MDLLLGVLDSFELSNSLLDPYCPDLNKDKLHSEAATSVCSDIWIVFFQVKENNYRGHGDSVDQLCWHPSNPDLFVTASGDKTIRIWDVRTTKCIATVNTKGNYLERRL